MYKKEEVLKAKKDINEVITNVENRTNEELENSSFKTNMLLQLNMTKEALNKACDVYLKLQTDKYKESPSTNSKDIIKDIIDELSNEQVKRKKLSKAASIKELKNIIDKVYKLNDKINNMEVK
jgi:hypothetical protein